MAIHQRLQRRKQDSEQGPSLDRAPEVAPERAQTPPPAPVPQREEGAPEAQVPVARTPGSNVLERITILPPGAPPPPPGQKHVEIQPTVPNFGAAPRVPLQRQPDIGARITARLGKGTPLPSGPRQEIEQGLDASLSGVHVHTDGEAHNLATSVQAVAFTTGSDIFFRQGAYNPGTEQGMHLLAHEATHTVQQSRGPVDGTPQAGGIAVSDPNDRFEQAASAVARDVTALSVQRTRGGAHLPVQRQAMDGYVPVQRNGTAKAKKALRGVGKSILRFGKGLLTFVGLPFYRAYQLHQFRKSKDAGTGKYDQEKNPFKDIVRYWRMFFSGESDEVYGKFGKTSAAMGFLSALLAEIGKWAGWVALMATVFSFIPGALAVTGPIAAAAGGVALYGGIAKTGIDAFLNRWAGVRATVLYKTLRKQFGGNNGSVSISNPTLQAYAKALNEYRGYRSQLIGDFIGLALGVGFGAAGGVMPGQSGAGSGALGGVDVVPKDIWANMTTSIPSWQYGALFSAGQMVGSSFGDESSEAHNRLAGKHALKEGMGLGRKQNVPTSGNIRFNKIPEPPFGDKKGGYKNAVLGALNPINLLAGSVALLLAPLLGLERLVRFIYKNRAKIKSAFVKAKTKVADWFKAAGTKTKDAFKRAGTSTKAAFKTAGTKTKTAFSNAGTKIKSAFTRQPGVATQPMRMDAYRQGKAMGGSVTSVQRAAETGSGFWGMDDLVPVSRWPSAPVTVQRDTEDDDESVPEEVANADTTAMPEEEEAAMINEVDESAVDEANESTGRVAEWVENTRGLSSMLDHVKGDLKEVEAEV